MYGNIEGVKDEERVDIKPNNVYGLTKLMGERLVEYYVDDLEAVIVRPFMLYHEDECFGDNRSAMIRFVKALVNREMIIVHKGSTRSWLHMDDAVVIFERLLRHSGVTVNVGYPEVVATETLAGMMCEMMGRGLRRGRS